MRQSIVVARDRRRSHGTPDALNAERGAPPMPRTLSEGHPPDADEWVCKPQILDLFEWSSACGPMMLTAA